MTLEQFQDYCLSLPGVTEEFPFGEETLVYKVAGKMFALSGIEDFETINLKCDPDTAVELRERYDGVEPGYHMNKKHWNSVYFDTGQIPRKQLLWMIDHSYDEIVKKLPKKAQQELN